MNKTDKTNRLAIISFVCGSTALLLIAIIFTWQNMQPIGRGSIDLIDGILMPVRNLSVFTAILTGILALREIKRNNGTKKSRIFAWIGIIIGSTWIIFGLLVGAAFLLGELFH